MKAVRLENPAGRQSLLELLVGLSGAALCIAAVLMLNQKIQANSIYPLETDLSLYLAAGEAIINGASPYSVHTGFDRYGYPPLFADAFAVFRLLFSREVIAAFWPWLCFVAAAGAILALFRCFGRAIAMPYVILVIGVVLLGENTRSNAYHGQATLLILALFVFGVLAYLKGKPIVASILLGVLICIKPPFGVVVGYFLLKRDWRMSAYVLISSGAIFVLSFIPLLPNVEDAFVGWLNVSAHFSDLQFASKPDNKSMHGFFLRILQETPFSHPWINAPALILVLDILVGLLALAVAWVGLGYRSSRRLDFRQRAPEVLLGCAMMLALIMSTGPLTEGGHLALALPGLAAASFLAWDHIREGSGNRVLWILVVLAWAAPALFVLSPYVVPVNGTRVFHPDDAEKLTGLRLLLTARTGILLAAACVLSAVALRWNNRWNKRTPTIPDQTT